MKEEKEYDDIEYFLFEQSVAYNNKEEEYEDSIPFQKVKMLTKKQLKLYKFLQEYKEHNEIMPKFDEMREHMNVKSKNTIHQMLGYIEWKGYIKRYPAQARAIKIIKEKA